MAPPTPSLPMDAIEHILSWLPVKSVLRYRSVSKSWSSLTRTRHFLHLHHLRSNARSNLLLRSCIRNKRNIIDIDAFSDSSSSLTLLRTLKYNQNSASLQCCDGVIAMHPRETLVDSKTSISNPSTTETLDVPFNTRAFRDYECASSYVGFEPVAGRYKLVIMATWHKRLGNTKRCEIATLGTSRNINDHEWREVDVTGTPPIEDGPGTCFSFAGALHWLSSDHRRRELLCFDLESEEFRTIPGPERLQNDPATWKLCEVGGCLALAEFGVYYEGGLKLWMLRDYENNVWVERTIVVSSPKVFGRCVGVVGSINGDEVLIATKSRENEMVCYDMKDKTCREVRETQRRGVDDEDQFVTMLYRESMIPLIQA